MEKLHEQYKPTPEDIEKAEGMMTKEQKEMSKQRAEIYERGLIKKEADPKVVSLFEKQFGRGANMEYETSEVVLFGDWGVGSYISYQEGKLTLAVGTSFDAKSEPETISADLQNMMAKRAELQALGYHVEINQANEIYELVFDKEIDIDGLDKDIDKIKDILGIQKIEKQEKKISPEQTEFLEKANRAIDDYINAYDSSMRSKANYKFSVYDSGYTSGSYKLFPIEHPVRLPEDFDRQDVKQVRVVLSDIEKSILYFKGNEAFLELMGENPVAIDPKELEKEFIENSKESTGSRYKWKGYHKDSDAIYKDGEHYRAKNLALIAAQAHKSGNIKIRDEALKLAREAASCDDYDRRQEQKYISIALAELVSRKNNEASLKKAEGCLMVHIGSYETSSGVFPHQRRVGLANIAKIREISGLETETTISKLNTLEKMIPGSVEYTKKCIKLLKEIRAIKKENKLESFGN